MSGFIAASSKTSPKSQSHCAIYWEKWTSFHFSKERLTDFNTLKEKFSIPILTSSDWDYPFEFMCNASDHAMVTLSSQCKEKISYVIYYASMTFDEAHMNYATNEKAFSDGVRI